ncbi:MAG TPA: RsmE family RNA methyltransferase, partial [Burkholderiaceae bacterium]|nr:RsmE family RNA methyltransferase [Burkholderiaceae bacterium]
MTPRLYFDGSLAEAVQVELDDAAAHHATTVLRLRSDDEIELFNGDGWRYRARLQLQRRGRAGARIERRYRADTDSGIDVLLAQAVATADKMDWVIEKAVELGVSAIQPIAAARSLARLDAARAERRQTHWQRVIVAACMQCGRDRLPTLSAVQPLAPWLAGRA